MIEGLRLAGREHVLEIGTGYGFQTTLLAMMAADVVSIERWPDLVEHARGNLARHDIGPVRLLVGDGSLGVPDFAPFDGIIASATYPRVPRPLVEQLRIGGRLVQPIGTGGHDVVVAFERTVDGLARREELTPARPCGSTGNMATPPTSRDAVSAGSLITRLARRRAPAGMGGHQRGGRDQARPAGQ